MWLAWSKWGLLRAFVGTGWQPVFLAVGHCLAPSTVVCYVVCNSPVVSVGCSCDCSSRLGTVVIVNFCNPDGSIAQSVLLLAFHCCSSMLLVRIDPAVSNRPHNATGITMLLSIAF